MIESYLLEQLLAFEKFGTLSKAAQFIHMSQPSLSLSMKRLEDLIGVPLFTRTKNRIILNENGQLLVKYAHELLEFERNMIQQIRLADVSQHELHYASISPTPVFLLDSILQQLSTKKVKTQLIDDNDLLFSSLLEDKVEFIISTTTPKNPKLATIRLFQEQLYLSVDSTHLLATKKNITFQDIATENILLFKNIGFWMNVCRFRLPSANFLIMDNFEAFTKVADTGNFPHFTSNVMQKLLTSPDNKVLLPLEEKDSIATYYLIFKKQYQDTLAPILTHLNSHPII